VLHRGRDSAVPPRIVLADDDEALVYSLTRLLEGAGYQVSAFSSSNLAWDSLRTEPRPALLIADVVFPPGQVHGIALAAHANMHHPRLPVIYLTGYEAVTPSIAADRRAVVLTKPIDEAELLRFVREMAPLSKSAFF
jgi:FixJ family two-component response regulator